MPELEVERRRHRRAVLRLPVHVVDTEAGFEVFEGVTVDVSICGLRCHLQAHLWDRLPPTNETTVQLELPDGSELVASAVVADGWPCPEGGYEYRIVFVDPEPGELARLEAVLGSEAA